MLRIGILFLLLAAASPSRAAESCFAIRGRAHLYGGDGQLRIWHIGTRHDFEPDEISRIKVESWLEAGVEPSDKTRYAIAASMLFLFADFLICPNEPFQSGSVQRGRIISATNRRYLRVQ